ncbi:MAG: sodium:proton antiporter NhaD [Prevotella sp.]|nr:sodium:proton antiporter NhaD [Prevotella sp.]
MSTLTIAIVIVFVMGYALIATESLTKINKAAIALLMFVCCWTLYMVDPAPFVQLMHPDFKGTADQLVQFTNKVITEHLGDTSTTLFFLMGAMTIVEIVDQNGGFNWVKNVMSSKSKRSLLWKIAFMTFFLSAILDNLTTSIVMIMILRKLVRDHKDRMIYASLVIIAANSGGAFSPIGDVTTIMLWNAGMITAAGVISEIFVPSVISMVIPAFVLQFMLKGKLGSDAMESDASGDTELLEFSGMQRKIIFGLGVGGLCLVPVFRYFTNLPPFVGILLVLGILWTVTELFYRGLHREKGDSEDFSKRVTNLLSRIDMSTILFFLGILMAVACLEEVGVLTQLGKGLNVAFNGNHFMVTGIIGVLSSIVDNVPLVAGCMGMYPIQAATDFGVDGIFWQLLAYCAGVGGSMLIIGSAAGVVVMGLEKITFGWYMKHISWIALVGYLAGILCYWIIREFIFTVPA